MFFSHPEIYINMRIPRLDEYIRRLFTRHSFGHYDRPYSTIGARIMDVYARVGAIMSWVNSGHANPIADSNEANCSLASCLFPLVQYLGNLVFVITSTIRTF